LEARSGGPPGPFRRPPRRPAGRTDGTHPRRL